MNKSTNYSDDDLRRYRKLPAKEVLRWLTEINELAQKLRQKKSFSKSKKTKT